ncbi:MAG: hypothetical protein NE330_21925, partial [Lentisphaeraceae bacterium]|nr:hypothetical protein [Lentisphaeraceae bacterium]
CMNNLKQIGTGIMLYVNANNGKMAPRANGGAKSWNGFGAWNGLFWDENIYQYMSGGVFWISKPLQEIKFQILKCPLDSNDAAQQRQRRSYQWNNGSTKDRNNSAKYIEFNMKPFFYAQMISAHDDAYTPNVILITDFFYKHEAIDGTFGFNGGTVNRWLKCRMNQDRHHIDYGRNGLTISGGVKHLKANEMATDPQMQIKLNYFFPTYPD